MTDDLGSLRQAMSDLSEHGGSSDMYERALRKSRQTQRRMASTTAAAAVVLAIGGTVAFAAAHRPDSSPPAAGRPPAFSTAPTSLGPSTTTSPSPDCPSTAALANLVELPEGWSFTSSQAKCAGNWAAADVKRVSPGGSIYYLFRYTTGTGWQYHDQATGWKCTDLGLTEPAPFCTS